MLIDAGTSLLVFALLVVSAVGGAFVRSRAPVTFTSSETRDVIRRVISLIAVLAAVMLGVGIAALKSTFDNADRDVRRLGVQIEELDRTLRRIGPPGTEARQLLFRFAAVLARDTFPNLDGPFRGEPRNANLIQDELEAALERLGTGEPVPRVVVQAQAMLHAIVQTRWTMEERMGPSMSDWQLVVLVFWLMLIFLGLGLFAARNTLVVIVLLLFAAALTGAIFLLTEFDDPFTGVISVSGAPLLDALHALADN